jgi:murein DD-endopeptidase MepM/ murein hydrolase activator NlpD
VTVLWNNAMRYITLLFLGMILLAGCLQRQAAPIDERGGRFFGKSAQYDMRGNELPRYSNDNPAPMPQNQDAKYVDDSNQTYGLSAALDPVAASDLPPVETAKAAAAVTATDAQLSAQQAADKVAAEARLAEAAATAKLQALKAAAPTVPAIAAQQTVTQQMRDQQLAASEAANNARRELSSITAALITQPAITPPPEFVWPLKGEMLKDFRTSGGESIAIAGRSGEPIRAAGDGTVVYVGDKLQGYGTMVILQHAKGYVTTYGHLSDAVVAKNDTVISGQLIGFVGKTGNVTAPQLQFSLHQAGKAVDPTGLLKK